MLTSYFIGIKSNYVGTLFYHYSIRDVFDVNKTYQIGTHPISRLTCVSSGGFYQYSKSSKEFFELSSFKF